MNYGYTLKKNLGFEDAVEKAKVELSKEGFGILTEIDVKATLKKKLKVDYEDYLILGACNPSFAYKALESEKEIGLLLPCNLIVYSSGGEVYVSTINPIIAMSVVDNEKLKGIAEEIGEKSRKVIDLI